MPWPAQPYDDGKLPVVNQQSPNATVGIASNSDWMSSCPAGMAEAQEVVAAAMETQFSSSSSSQTHSSLQHCNLLNISVCHATVAASAQGRGFSVALYNPLAWPRKEPVRVPLGGNSTAWAVSGRFTLHRGLKRRDDDKPCWMLFQHHDLTTSLSVAQMGMASA